MRLPELLELLLPPEQRRLLRIEIAPADEAFRGDGLHLLELALREVNELLLVRDLAIEGRDLLLRAGNRFLRAGSAPLTPHRESIEA